MKITRLPRGRTAALLARPVSAVIFMLLSFLLLSCASAKQSAAGQTLERNPAIISGTLPGGLSYSILRNARPENRILFRLAVKAGSVLEDDDQRGLAHLVEHMAFSSTAHFGENELIHYFESIGMAWGADLNAYTSFDETVYQLEIPADNEEILRTGLTVLWDWAYGITFDPALLQKERDVVIEEWRMHRGFQGRARDMIYPFMFAGSRYASRLPIGDPEIILNAPRERVVDFYQRWYRNELMSIIIVGDVDPQMMENALKRQFAALDAEAREKSGSAPEGAVERPQFAVPALPAQKSLVITDPESSYPVIQVYALFTSGRIRTESDYKNFWLAQTAASVLSERLAEKAEEDGAPFVYADSSFYQIIRPLSAASTVCIPKDGQFDQAFKSMLDEIDRFAIFGITRGELERQKSNLLAGARRKWENRNKTESAALISELVSGELYDEPSLSPDAEYALSQKLIESVTVDEINAVIKKYFGTRGKLLIVTAPDNVLPSQSEIEAVWKKYKPSAALSPPVDGDNARALFEPPGDFSRGSVISEKKLAVADASPDVTELTLSNGAKVLVCPTDFKADTFLFTAITRGGMSLLGDIESLSAAQSADYLELSGLNGFSQAEITKMLAGKQVSIYPRITQTTASLNGSAAAEDIETFFQFIYLYFTAPYFTQSAWERLLSNMAIEISGRKNNPQDIFYEEIYRYIYSDSPRLMNITEESIKLLDANLAEKFYRQYFSDAGKFTFIFTGDVDVDAVKQLSETYIAQIPSSRKAPVSPDDGQPIIEARAATPAFPKGAKTITVRKGLEEQAVVCIIAGGENQTQIHPPLIEAELVSLAAMLAETRLTETLRLKIGSVYGLSADFSVLNYPVRRFFADIVFPCEPSRAGELIAIVHDELQRLRTTPPSAAEITMLKETFTRKRETAVKTNNFWHNGFVRNIGTGQGAGSFAPDAEVLAQITPENIQQYIQIYAGMENAATGILLPSQDAKGR